MAEADPPIGTVTLLFTDIEGSTRLSQHIGEECYAGLLEDHRRLLREAVVASRGWEFGTEGDALFAVFTTAAAAVAAAANAQRLIADYPWPDGAPIKVRMGVHTGEVARGASGGYVGLALHRVARISAAAHGGQVVLSEATKVLVGDALPPGVSLRELGRFRLKDFDAPERLFELVVPGLQETFPPLRTIEATPNNLPRQLTSFIGRQNVLETGRRLLEGTRLLTLTGPGGTGKTRLSLRLAEDVVSEFPDGVFFVPLAAIRDPELVASTIAHALGLPEATGRPALAAVIDFLGDHRVLLILDNFEQILGAAPLLGELLRAAPGMCAVVTSRSVLHVSGEQEFPVPPLGVPDLRHLPALAALAQYEAVALFIERARAARPDFQVTDANAPAVAGICARLDGLPLAIELAAARIRLLSPEAILARLERRLPLLGGGSSDVDVRQQTLRGAIAWSYELLDAPARVLFARLAVFVGGWTLSSAEAVCEPERADGGDILDGVGTLADQSLIHRDDAHADPAGEPRFVMLETIREFGLEQLEAAGESTATRQRHAVHFLGLAERARAALEGAERVTWLDLLEADDDNLRAAVAWALEVRDTDIAYRLLTALWRFWQSRDHLVEGAAAARAILAQGGRVAPVLEARAHEAAGGLAWWIGDRAWLQSEYETFARLARDIADPGLLADALYDVSFVYLLQTGLLAEGGRVLDEAITLYQQLGDERGRGRAQWARATVDFAAQDYQHAEGLLTEALTIAEETGDAFNTGWTLHMLGSAESHTGNLAASWRHLRDALVRLRAAGETTGLAICLDDLAFLAATLGDYTRGARLHGAARTLEETTGAGVASVASSVMQRATIPVGTLTTAEIEALTVDGRAMTLDAAIELALAIPQPAANEQEAV